MTDQPLSLSSDERAFAQNSLMLARRGHGQTAPNPSVGALITRPVNERGQELISRGWTQPGGRPHAEAMAIEVAYKNGRAEVLKGAHLYVTLEPCSHHGKTPPCSQAIIDAGIKVVFYGVRDPDPRVAGRGLAQLQSAGIKVVPFDPDLAARARWLHMGHILRLTRQRPFIQAKIALGADHRIARGGGAPQWVTGPRARQQGHLLRARADAILVGRQTIADDNPNLNCRLPGLAHRSPHIIVLDSYLKADPAAKIFTTQSNPASNNPVLLYSAKPAQPQNFAADHVVFKQISQSPDGAGLDLNALCADLAHEGITRLLIEGGPKVVTSFLEAGLVDELVTFIGPKPVGAQGLTIGAAPDSLMKLLQKGNFSLIENRFYESDEMKIYRRDDEKAGQA